MDIARLTKCALRGVAILENKPRVSQAMLGRLLGVGRSQVGRWMRGEATPRRYHFMKLVSLSMMATMVDNLRAAMRRELGE